MRKRHRAVEKVFGALIATLLVVAPALLPGVAFAATVVSITSSETWTVPAGVTSVNVLVVAGGGSGGGAGGGGGGGVVYAANYAVTPLAGVTVTIGAGGSAVTCATGCTTGGNAGSNSVFGSITALGGGAGGSYGGVAAGSGGSGGGGGSNTTNTGGAATQGSSGGGIGYGYAGGTGSNSNAPYTSGGGGGAGALGSSANGAAAGAGGQGYLSNISGTATYYAGGGGGGTQQASGVGGNGGAGGGGGGACYIGTSAGTGGSNGGASGACSGGPGGYGIGGAGGANSGGGGGGASISVGTGGAGGSGIVIVSYGAPNITISVPATVTGNASVLGTVSKGSGTFVIDDPLDPKNKLLYHSFVESPDVLDWYDGTTTLDSAGNATIELPNYFLALNEDFRYLASPMDQSMPNLHLSGPVHRKYFFGLLGPIVFSVGGGVPGGEISWQVTGIRHDPYILANPIIPVVEKGPGELVDQGQYLFPQFYAK